MAGIAAAASLALTEARNAAQDVKKRASDCKVQSLRDEALSIAQKAQEVLNKIEQKAHSGEAHHVHDAVEQAARKAHNALSRVQGWLGKAAREYKGGFFSKVKASLDTSHKKSFREAHEDLVAALRALDSSLDVTHGDQDPAGPSAMAAASGGSGSRAQPLQQESSCDGGVHLHLRNWDRGCQVLSVGLVPVGGVRPSLWVGLNKQTEFYPACEVARKHVEKGKGVTCIVCEADMKPPRVWTGHADGTVMLTSGANFGVASYRTPLGLPIRALAVDARRTCWVGDDAGVTYMLHIDRNNTLLVRKVEVPPAAADYWQTATRSAGAAAAVLGGVGSSSTRGAPILALFSKGPVVFSSGGGDRNYITMWNSHNCDAVVHSNTQTYGPAHSFAAVDWGQSPPADAAAAAGGYDPRAGDFCGWRLLSGHESGQVLLWQVHGLSTRQGMQPMQLQSIILEPRQLSAIKFITFFEDFGMMVLADGSGVLAVSEAPTATNGAVSSSATPGALPGSIAATRWTPRQGIAKIKAHKSGIISAAAADELLVTASGSTVKSWTADQLKLEAQGDGLMFSRSSRSLTATRSTLSSAVNAAMVGSGLPSNTPVDRTSYHSHQSGLGTDVSADNMGSGGSGTNSTRSGLGAQGDTGLGRDTTTSFGSLPGRGSSSRSVSTGQSGQQLARGLFSDASGLSGTPTGEAAGVLSRGSSSGRAVGPSASKPNPFSKAAVEARGMVVGANNRVIPAVLRGLPEQQALALQQAVAPVMQMLATPQWQPQGLMPLPMHVPMGPMSYAPSAYPTDAAAGGAVAAGTGFVDEAGGLTETSSIKPSDTIRAEHLICSAELELNQPIGIGAEGKVYRGKWCNIDIAAKEYLAVEDGECEQLTGSQEPTEAAKNRAKNALLKEVGLLAKLTHPNLVRFCGVCLDPPLVVMEYYKNGSVYKMLECARAAVMQGRTNRYVNYLSWKRRLEMLHDVASGMMYLHSRRYVHGDLRSPNLFVTENGRVKIGDFGFTKRLKRSKETIKVGRITHPRWVAPELLNAYELSTASDVYSFGIIMYEVLTFKIPFEECTKALVAIHVLANKMRPHIPTFENLPPNTSRVCLANYIRLMEDCWHQDPAQRPSFHQVARRLKAMQRWFWACNNALKLTNTTMRLQYLRQNSKNREEGVPVPPTPSAPTPPAAATSAGSSVAQAGAAVAGGIMAAAAGMLGSLAGRSTSAAQQPKPQPSQQQTEEQAQQHDALDGPHTQEAPPPVPEPEDVAAAKATAPAPAEEPSVQVRMVDNKPLVCIDMGEGKRNMEKLEEELLVQMQSITLAHGEAAAKQAQFIIVGSDLPHRTLSSISEMPLPTQQSGGSGLTAGTGPFAAGLPPGSTTDGGRSPSAVSATDLSGPTSNFDTQLSGTSALGDHGAAATAAGAEGVAPQLPAIREGRELQSRSTGATASTGRGSGGIGSSGIAAAAAAGAGAAGAVAVLSKLPSPPPPIRVGASSAAHAGAAAGDTGTIDAYVRDASEAVTHEKVKDWLAAGTGSMELSPALQQRLQQQAAAGHSAAASQRDQQGHMRAAPSQQQGQQEQADVFGAEDSPFFLLPPACASSGSVELGAFQRVGGAGVTAAGAFGSATPSLMDFSGWDDSRLPAADGSGAALSEAATICYPEACTPAEALVTSVASIRSASFTSSAPTLWNLGAAPATTGGMSSRGLNSGDSQPQRGRPLPDGSSSNPYSFSATERSPFALEGVAADEDAPLSAAPAQPPLPQVDSNVMSCGPFGRMKAGSDANGAGQTQLGQLESLDLQGGAFAQPTAAVAGAGLGPGQQDSVVREPGPFGHGAPAGLAAGEDSVVRDIGPFGQMMGAGLAVGEDSVVRDAGPFGAALGGALGGVGVNEDSIAPPLPGEEAAAAGGPEQGLNGLRASPPPSPGPGRTSAAGSSGAMAGGQFGQIMQQGQMQPASPKSHHYGLAAKGPVPMSRSPRYSSSAGQPGFGGVHGPVPVAAAATADGRRWSNSSKASSVAAAAAAAGMHVQHDGAAGEAGGAGPSTPAATAGGIPHKPLDESVLNRNLRDALGGPARAPEEDGLDLVDMQQRDLAAWQSQNRGSSSTQRQSNSSSSSSHPTAPMLPGWPGHPHAAMPGGMLPADGVKGWVPGMMPAEAVLHPYPGAGMHPEAGGPVGQMPGWAADGTVPYGATIAARGRIPSGVDVSAGSMGAAGWGAAPGTSPGAGPQGPYGASPCGPYDPAAAAAMAGRPGMIGPQGVGTMQTAAYMQMQAAAAANVTAQVQAGAGNWFSPVRGAVPYGMMGQPGQVPLPGSTPVAPGYMQPAQMADPRQQAMWHQQQQQQQQQQQLLYQQFQQRGLM